MLGKNHRIYKIYLVNRTFTVYPGNSALWVYAGSFFTDEIVIDHVKKSFIGRFKIMEGNREVWRGELFE